MATTVPTVVDGDDFTDDFTLAVKDAIDEIQAGTARTQLTLSGASQTLTAGPGVYTKAIFTAVGVEAGGDWISVPDDTVTVPETGVYLALFRALRGSGNWGSSNVVVTVVGSATYHYPPTGTNNMTVTWCGYLNAGMEVQFDVLNPGTASTMTTLAQFVKIPWVL